MRSLIAMVLVITAVRADFIAPTVATHGWDRPTAANPYSTFQAWETFTAPAGPNAPETVFGAGTGDPATVTMSPPFSNFNVGYGGAAGATWTTVNAAGTPNVADTSGQAFITSGGNIYSPFAAITPSITIPNNLDGIAGLNTEGTTTVLLQLRTQGSGYNPATMLLTDGTTTVAPASTTLLASQAVSGGGFGGFLYDTVIRFDIPGNADLYTINFSSDGSSMSLDRVAVDTHWFATPVPEPSLLLAGGMILFAIGRRTHSRTATLNSEGSH